MKISKKNKILVFGNSISFGVYNIYCKDSKGCCNCGKNNNSNEKNTKDTYSKTETTKEEKPKDDTVLKNKIGTVKKLYEEVLDLYGKLTEDQKGSFTNKTEFKKIKSEDIESKNDINELNNIENLLNSIKGNIENIIKKDKPKEEPKPVDIPKVDLKAAEHKDGGNPKVETKVEIKDGGNPKVDTKDGGNHKVELKVDHSKVNKIENFGGINNLTVELKDNKLILYSSEKLIPFAYSVDEFKGEFNVENIKKMKIKFHNAFYSYKGDKDTIYYINPVFAFKDIDGFLKNIATNDSCVLKDIFEDGKFITFKSGDEYYCYDVINNYLYRLLKNLKTHPDFKDKVKAEQHYFVVKTFPSYSVCFYNSNGEYGAADLIKKAYELYTKKKDIDDVKDIIMGNPFIKKNK